MVVSPERGTKRAEGRPRAIVRRPRRSFATPRVGTLACREYFLTYRQVNSFYHFVLHAVAQLDHSAELAHNVLVDTAPDPEERRRLEDDWSKRKKAVDALREQRQFFLEVLLVRHVENYLNYLSALLFEIFTQRPETLRSSDNITVEEVLRHATVETIVRSVAERKVDSLSYSSFQDLAAFFKDRFSLVIANNAELPTVVHAIEIRNISVHNRCIVNRRFVSRTGDTSTSVGRRKVLSIDYLDRLVPLLANVVKQLDREARVHLKLKGARFEVSSGAA